VNEPLISFHLDRVPRIYFPGDDLSGEYQIDATKPEEVAAIEMSILWLTEGKGDEDLYVHDFERRENAGPLLNQLHVLHRFSNTLPNSPLTYEGSIVKIHWCVRIRLFMADGQEFVEDFPFELAKCESVDTTNP